MKRATTGLLALTAIIALILLVLRLTESTLPKNESVARAASATDTPGPAMIVAATAPRAHELSPESGSAQVAAQISPLPGKTDSSPAVKGLLSLVESGGTGDQRFDQAVAALRPSDLSALQAKYRAMPTRDYDARSAIVLAIGSLKSPETTQFLEDLLMVEWSGRDDLKTLASLPANERYNPSLQTGTAMPELLALDALIEAAQSNPAERERLITLLEKAKRNNPPPAFEGRLERSLAKLKE